MAFIAEKKTYRIYDLDRDLELGQGPGAHGHNTSYFHKIGQPDDYMGGGIRWFEERHNLTEQEHQIYPDTVKVLRTFTIKSIWTGQGEFELKGFSRKETMEMVKEALIAGRGALKKEVADLFYDRVLLWPVVTEWIEGE